MLGNEILIKDELHYLEEFFKHNGSKPFVVPQNFSYEKLNRLASEFDLFFLNPGPHSQKPKKLRRKYAAANT